MDKKYKKQNNYNNFKGSNNSKQTTHRNRSAEPNRNRNDNKNSNKNNNRGRSLSRKRNFQDNRSRSPSATRPKMIKILNEKYNEIDRSHLIELEPLDSDNIIIFFSKNHLALGKLLNTDDFNIMVLFLRVITKLCVSNFNENKTKIIKRIIDTNFLQILQNETASLAFQDKKDTNIFYWADQNRFWNDLFQLYETIFNILPKRSCQILPKFIISHINTLNNINIKEIIVNFDELQTKINNYAHQQHSFRNMNVFPAVEEVTNRQNPELQSLKQDYKSVEEYLDIHFRLLREDYVQSVRTGICNYLENEKYKQSNVRIYENVKFIRPHIAHDRVGILVNCGYKTTKDDMIETKRFQPGTLVCFSKDKFKEIVYATIFRQSNDENLVTDGYIVVDIHNPIIYDQNYVMIETKITFETYSQVLLGLQNLKPENFPMKKYIIDCEQRMERPEYLAEQCKIELDKPYVFKNKNYSEFKMNSFWPPKEYFSLNTSQYTAFKTALTSKFSVIHGPPGTGKTYTTLKIVEFLLKNKPNLEYIRPILVICYSNHALDQFLEGILPFCKDILRVKNQKNTKMDDFDLRYHRKQIENDRDSYCREILEEEKTKVDQCVQKLQCLQNLLEDISSKTGIIDFEYFKKIDKQLNNSWFDRANNKDIVDWLIGETDSVTVQKTFVNQMSEINKCYCKASIDDRKTVLINANNEYNSNKHFTNNCILKQSDIKAHIKNLENEFVELKRNERSRRDHFLLNKHEQEILRLVQEEIYLQEQLNRPQIQPSLKSSLNYSNPYNICKSDRWALYHYWVHLLQLRAYKDIAILDEEYRAAKRRLLEVQNMVDIRIMQEKSVIGMTTFAAAKHQPTLQTLKCEIVIVEEAAEILESHVVAALTNHCQQLILIGDHLQLRPSTQQHNLAKNYNLEISLFERMVKNNIHYTQLEVQHRMRPEFSKLISPSIYPNLINDERVLYYPPVRGMAKNLYFITHNEFENQTKNNTSKRNIYEAKYLLNLVSYLIKQGYTASEITVLTSYKSQKNALEKERAIFSELENIRIEVVDNFQGEENKIILLSLVRSNERQDIGFVKVQNRVCVLLSRAKEGFYMIGNVDNFEKSSLIWPKVIEVLKKDNSIGPCLTLKCQNHNNETKINNLNDFDKVSNGGCTFYCNENLSCGHLCKYRCHPIDRKHVQYTCKERCTKVLCKNGHVCPLLCSEPCKACEYISDKCLPCGHFAKISCSTDPWDHKCTEIRIASLQCGHPITIECYKNSNDVKCSRVCEKRLNCGHFCKRECHKDDLEHKLYICRTPTNKQFINCSHTITLPCNTDIGNRNCVQECGKRMPCQHICKNKCHATPCKCNEMGDKIIEACGHTARVKCSVIPRQQFCYKRCQQVLECGHRCNRKCNETCACPMQCVPENESDLQCCMIL